ncbi:MAG: hypothetical protein ABIP73_15525 [Gemmatimonadaceae bacterium]
MIPIVGRFRWMMENSTADEPRQGAKASRSPDSSVATTSRARQFVAPERDYGRSDQGERS